jgi:hypothetical protein
MPTSTAFEHLKELHEKYARHDLRGMWQRDGSSALRAKNRRRGSRTGRQEVIFRQVAPQ